MTFPITYAGARMWADPSGVEPSAPEQIRNTFTEADHAAQTEGMGIVTWGYGEIAPFCTARCPECWWESETFDTKREADEAAAEHLRLDHYDAGE